MTREPDHLAKVRVAGSNPVVRSKKMQVGEHLWLEKPPKSSISYTRVAIPSLLVECALPEGRPARGEVLG